MTTGTPDSTNVASKRLGGTAHGRARRSARVVAVTELAIGVAAVVGGILLAVRPDGSLLAADRAVLRGTPFSDWRSPGALLAILVGGGFLVTGTAEWLGRRLAAALSTAAGLGLVAFELAQMQLIGWQPLQAVLGTAGLAVAAISLGRMHHASHQGRRPRTTPSAAMADGRSPTGKIGAGRSHARWARGTRATPKT